MPHLIVARITSIALQLIFVLLLSRIVGIGAVGVYTLGASVAATLVVFSTFDLNGKILAGIERFRLSLILLTPTSALLLVSAAAYMLPHYRGEASVIIILTVFKLGESLSEAKYTYFRKDLNFRTYLLLCSLRNVVVYVPSIIVLIVTRNFLSTITVLALGSILVATYDCSSLRGRGWSFTLKLKGGLRYVLANISLGAALTIKALQTYSIRYYVILFYGLEMVGYLTPAFYALTVCANLATLLDSYFTPKVIKSLDDTAYPFNKGNILFQAGVVLAVLATAIVVTPLFSKSYFHLFFPAKEFQFSSIYLMVACGIVPYSLRGILRVISYRLGLVSLQLRIQTVSLMLMIALVFILDLIMEIPGIFLAHLLSSLITVIIYLRLILPRIRGLSFPGA